MTKPSQPATWTSRTYVFYLHNVPYFLVSHTVLLVNLHIDMHIFISATFSLFCCWVIDANGRVLPPIAWLVLLQSCESFL